ncbi:transporter [bacterium]|nr:transporter [bacterium]
MKKLVGGSFLVAVCATVLTFSPAAFGGGGQHYPNGAEDCFCGAAPPPGWHIVNYLLYYDANKMDTPAGEMDIDLNLRADVFRVIYSSDKKILGGNYLCHLFIPYMNVDFDTIGYSESNFADPIIDPFIIAWHGKTYHAVAGLDIYVPIGKYDENSPINLVGKNFWTFEPIFAVTGIYETGWSWSLKLMYDFNTKNNEFFNPMTGMHSDLEPGDEFHFDYSLDYAVSSKVRLGACGYYYKQVDDDEIDGIDVLDDKGEVFAVGPVFMYSPSKNLHLVAKAQFEVETENRPEGNAFWFKIIYSF